jgi:hypothetical protein
MSVCFASANVVYTDHPDDSVRPPAAAAERVCTKVNAALYHANVMHCTTVLTVQLQYSISRYNKTRQHLLVGSGSNQLKDYDTAEFVI